MPPKPGKPYQSQLNPHLAEIARLRKTKPYPTPYKKIAEILKAKYGLEISPNAVWAFVRNRALAHERKIKYKLPDELSELEPAASVPDGPAQPASPPPQPAPSHPTARPTERPGPTSLETRQQAVRSARQAAQAVQEEERKRKLESQSFKIYNPNPKPDQQ